MELHHLRCVVAISDHGTFTAAAAALHVSQPALSHAVAGIERELGARLFERSSTGARLTAAGTAFLAPARRALAEADSSRSAVEALTGVLSGELRIAGVRTATVETAGHVVEFHRRHPGVSVILDEPTDDRHVIDAVGGGRCDIGIIHEHEKPNDLDSISAGFQEIVVIFPRALAARTKEVTIDVLGELPLVAPLRGTPARAAQDRFFRRAGKRPQIAAECSDHNALVELVRGGLGAALVSDSRAAACNDEGIVVRSLHPPIRTELTAIQRSAPSPAATAFFTMLAGNGTLTTPVSP